MARPTERCDRDFKPGLTSRSQTHPEANPAHKYAYIVGISNYAGTVNDLSYCDDDAREMKAWGRTHHLRTSARNTDVYTGGFDIQSFDPSHSDRLPTSGSQPPSLARIIHERP